MPRLSSSGRMTFLFPSLRAAVLPHTRLLDLDLVFCVLSVGASAPHRPKLAQHSLRRHKQLLASDLGALFLVFLCVGFTLCYVHPPALFVFTSISLTVSESKGIYFPLDTLIYSHICFPKICSTPALQKLNVVSRRHLNWNMEQFSFLSGSDSTPNDKLPKGIYDVSQPLMPPLLFLYK